MGCTFFCCFVASVDSFLQDICRHVPTVAGSLLEAQSVRLQAPVLPVGTLVPPTLWHFSGMTNEGAGFSGFLGMKDRIQTRTCNTPERKAGDSGVLTLLADRSSERSRVVII